MIRIDKNRLAIVVLFLLIVPLALVGCERPVAATGGGSETGYTGVLDTSYDGALDATGQLALGTMRLEGTPNAVTEPQAGQLLPLWRALQGSVLQGTDERDAVLRQIEGAMTDAQIGAVSAMRLSEADVATWADSQADGSPTMGGAAPGDAVQGNAPQGSGTGRQRQGGAGQGLTDEQSAQMRQQFQNMSPEDLATRRAQFAGQGGRPGAVVPAAAGSSRLLMAALTRLLVERSGGDAAPQSAPAATPAAPAAPRVRPTATPNAAPTEATPAPAATHTPAPTPTPVTTQVPATTPTPAPEQVAAATTPAPVGESALHTVRAGDTLAAIAQAYGVTVGAIAEANGIQDPNAISAGQELVIPSPARVPATSTSGALASSSAVPVTATLGGSLTWLPDTDPGPPFSIRISLNRAIQDPLVERSQRYQVTGLVRNDGDQTYAVSAIHVTFYDADGFRGTFSPAIRDGKLVGGEWHWHGETVAEFAALLLAPGETCPFSVEITGQDMASFLIHADAIPTGRQSVPVSLSNVQARDDGTGFVRITGTATNSSPYVVKGVTVSGVLLDGSGHIVSVGSTYGLKSGIEPGASVPFDLHVAREAYASYQLYAQAERDWD